MITKQSLGPLKRDINEALAKVGEKHGLTINTANATYDRDGNFATIKLEVNVIRANGETSDREAEDFKKYAHLYGFKPSDVGRKFTYGGKTYTITGMNTRAKRTPIITKDNNNRAYRFGVEVKRLLPEPAENNP